MDSVGEGEGGEIWSSLSPAEEEGSLHGPRSQGGDHGQKLRSVTDPPTVERRLREREADGGKTEKGMCSQW